MNEYLVTLVEHSTILTEQPSGAQARRPERNRPNRRGSRRPTSLLPLHCVFDNVQLAEGGERLGLEEYSPPRNTLIWCATAIIGAVMYCEACSRQEPHATVTT